MNPVAWLHLSEYDWFNRIGLGYPAVWGWIFLWIFAFGACWGSFLNVCIWRIPRGESLSKAASHCTSCGAKIKWFDNIPVVSFLLLHGRCRNCRQPYSCRYFLVELFCGAVFALLLLKTGLSKQNWSVFPNYAAAVFFALGCAWIDCQHRIIPDKMNFSAMVLAMFFAALMPQYWGEQIWWKGVIWSVVSGAVPMLMVKIFSFAGKLVVRQEVVGRGDIKFLMAAGMLLGMPAAVFVITAASLSGFIYGLLIRRKWNTWIPFGPFMALGVLVWVFADKWILSWYFNIKM